MDQNRPSWLETARLVAAPAPASSASPAPAAVAPADKSRSTIPCRFQNTLKGCMFGDACTFRHVEAAHFDPPTQAPSEDPAPSEDLASSGACLICLESLHKGQRVGVLPNCSHVFCLECLRNWRDVSEDATRHGQQHRACPSCRTVGYFVVPAPRPPKDEAERREVIEAHLLKCKSILCKFESSQKVCPFGSSCMYKHRPGPDALAVALGGEEASKRFVQNASGANKYMKSQTGTLGEFLLR